MTNLDLYPSGEKPKLTLEQIRNFGAHTLSGVAKKERDVSPVNLSDLEEQLESD